MNPLPEFGNWLAHAPAAVPILLDAALKSVLVLALAGIAALCMRRCSAAARHLVWFLAVACLPFLPLFSWALPGWNILPQWMNWHRNPAVTLVSRDEQTLPETPPNPPLERPIEATPPTAPHEIAPSTAPQPEFQSAAPKQGMDSLAVRKPKAAQPKPNYPRLGFFAWLAGVALALIPTALGLLSLWRLEKHSRRETAPSWLDLLRRLLDCLSFKRRVSLLKTSRRRMPMTWGIIHPKLLLPEESHEWADERRRVVLLHELAHAKRWDYLTNLVMRLACALYWFNPLVWFAARQMVAERERACDDIVLSQGAKPADYAEQILQIAAGLPAPRFAGYGAIAMARPSRLESRLLAILDNKRNRAALTRMAVIAALALLVAIVVPVAMMKAASGDSHSGALAASGKTPQTNSPPASVTNAPGQPSAPTSGTNRPTDVAELQVRSPSPDPPPSHTVLVTSASPEVDALCAAIYDRRWQGALKMIDSGVAVNGVDEQHRTPLDCLVERWYVATTQDETPVRREVLQKLLQHGADPFAPSATTYRLDDVRSPVEKAMGYADAALGHILLTNNPSPLHRTPSGETALHLAVREGRTNIIDAVLSQGFSANQTNDDGLTPLQEMVGMSSTGSFILAGNPPPYFVHSPGNRAAPAFGEKGYVYGDATVADFLLSRGATIDVFSATGMGLTNQLAALLRSNPKLANARDRFGRIPLHYAAPGQSNTMALLLEAGANPAAQTTMPTARKIYRTPDPAGCSPLHIACLHENQVNAQLLVNAGAPLAQADADGNTPLHIAACWGNTNLPKMLISAGAPLDVTNRAGQTPLRFAIQSGGSGNVEQLLKAGARTDIGLDNTTLLHIAAAPNGDGSRNNPPGMPPESMRAAGSARAIPALLAAGLAVDARDGQGRTPLQRAVTTLNLAAMETLLTNGADINAVDLHGDTALHQLSMQPWDKTNPDFFPQFHAPVEQKTQTNQPVQQQRVLMAMTNISVTSWLLEHGANPNLTNHEGKTPLELLRTHKWTNMWDEKDAAARIPLFLKAGVKASEDNMRAVTHAESAASGVQSADSGQSPASLASTNWGEAVDGISLRLWADKAVWNTGEIPSLRFSIPDQGTNIVWFSPDLEVDGIWYWWKPFHGIGPGGAIILDHLSMGSEWLTKTNGVGQQTETGSPLKLALGKHTVRLAILAGKNSEGTNEFRVVSNPVDIEVQTNVPAESATRIPKSPETILAELRNILPEDWTCELTKNPGEMEYSHGQVKEPLFRIDFTNANITFPISHNGGRPSAPHPYLRLYFLPVEEGTRFRLGDRDILGQAVILLAETPDYAVVTSFLDINNGKVSTVLERSTAPLGRALEKYFGKFASEKVKLVLGMEANASDGLTTGIGVTGQAVDDQTGKPIKEFSLEWSVADPKQPGSDMVIQSNRTSIYFGGRFGEQFQQEDSGWNMVEFFGERSSSHHQTGWVEGQKVWPRIRADGYLPQPVTPEPVVWPVRLTNLVVRLKRVGVVEQPAVQPDGIRRKQAAAANQLRFHLAEGTDISSASQK